MLLWGTLWGSSSPSAGSPPYSKITTNWHFGDFWFCPSAQELCEVWAGWVPSTGGDSCPGLGCTNLCWSGIPVQKWGVGCCREELPCSGYFWPHNLSSVSRPWRSNLPREGGALLEPQLPHPSSWGFGEKWEKPNCSGENNPKNAIFNQELSRGDLLHKVLHLCCFLIHFLPACLEFSDSPAAGMH